LATSITFNSQETDGSWAGILDSGVGEMSEAQISTTDSGKPKTLPTDNTKDTKPSTRPLGTDASHTDESDHHEDPAAGLRAQVYAKPADRKSGKKPDDGDNNPALAAVAVGTILRIKNGSYSEQAVVQQQLYGGKMLLLRDDKLKDAVGPYTPAPGETKLSQIPGTDLFMGHDNVVVRYDRDRNTFQRMFGYNLVLADQVTAQGEVTLPGSKDEQRVTSGRIETVQRPDGTEMRYPSNYDWGQKNINSLPLYSERFHPSGSMKVIRGANGEALLVDRAGTVLKPDEAGDLRVLTDVKVTKIGNLPSAYQYLDAETAKFKLPKDRIAGMSNGVQFMQTAEGEQLIAYGNLAGASQEYTPKPGERLRPITIDGTTYYRSVERGGVVERQSDGTYRLRPEFSLRLPYPSPPGENLTQPRDIVIPGGEPQQGPARPQREGSLAVQETGAGPADRSGLSSFDDLTMRDRIMDLRGQRVRTRDENRELAALEMVRSQMEADPKARTEFAERLAKLRELGGLAGVAIIVTAALEFCASRNGKQNDAAIRATVQ
jgi:hypothetical protein